MVVEVSVVADLFVVVVSVPVPVVVCGVSQAAIERAIRATNKMRFISLLFKLKNIMLYIFNYSAKNFESRLLTPVCRQIASIHAQ